jgi:hypothetical protein
MYLFFTNIFFIKKIEYLLAPFRHILSDTHILYTDSRQSFVSDTCHSYLQTEHFFHYSGENDKKVI